MNHWTEASDELGEFERSDESLNIDQRLQLIQIKALLAIGEALTHAN